MANAGFQDFQRIDAMVDPVERASAFWNDFVAQAPLTGVPMPPREAMPIYEGRGTTMKPLALKPLVAAALPVP